MPEFFVKPSEDFLDDHPLAAGHYKHLNGVEAKQRAVNSGLESPNLFAEGVACQFASPRTSDERRLAKDQQGNARAGPRKIVKQQASIKADLAIANAAIAKVKFLNREPPRSSSAGRGSRPSANFRSTRLTARAARPNPSSPLRPKRLTT